MANLKIKNETVFVVYKDGEPYQSWGRKLVYTTKGAANGVITTDSEEIARQRYEKYHGSWYDNLDREERSKKIDEVRKEFEVMEYGPKKVKHE
jgi:hypothetical protein